MEVNHQSWLKYAYVIILVSATIALGIDCFKDYLKDEDVSLTEYKKFNHEDQDNVYPSVTFCIENPFISKKLEDIYDDINITSYKNFLGGKSWDDRLLQIDYDNVTVSLDDALLGVRMNLFKDFLRRYSYGHKNTTFPDGNLITKFEPNFYVSLRLWNKKCFTFDVPYIEKHFMFSFDIYLRNSIFPSGVRPSKNGEDGSLVTFFHYPGQWITAGYTNKFEWPGKDINSPPYTMEFRIQNVQTIRRRDKKSKHCLKDMRSYDTMITDDHIAHTVGCRPPHYKTQVKKPLCTTKKEMIMFKKLPSLFALEHYYLPCKSIHNLRYDYYELDNTWCKYSFIS